MKIKCTPTKNLKKTFKQCRNKHIQERLTQRGVVLLKPPIFPNSIKAMRSKAIVLKIFSLVSQYYKTKSTQWRPKLKKKKLEKKILNETKSNVNSWKETIKPFFAISTLRYSYKHEPIYSNTETKTWRNARF